MESKNVRFAIRHIHPTEGNAWRIAQVMSLGGDMWEECLREAEQYQDESFEECWYSRKAIPNEFCYYEQMAFS